MFDRSFSFLSSKTTYRFGFNGQVSREACELFTGLPRCRFHCAQTEDMVSVQHYR